MTLGLRAVCGFGELTSRLVSGTRRGQSPGIPVVTYHSVADEALGLPDRYRVSPGRFAQQMRLIAASGFQVVGLDDLTECLIGGGVGSRERAVVLTFDDGYGDFYTNALPVLRRHGFQAAVFLVSDLVGGAARWDGAGADSGAGPRLLSWGEIRDARSAGIEFHSHSCTHPRLSTLNPKAAAREVIESRRTIERNLGVPVRYFCYPHGDASESVRRQVQEAGYRAAFSTEVGLSAAGQDPYFLRRVKVRPSDSLVDFVVKLYTGRGLREAIGQRRRTR